MEQQGYLGFEDGRPLGQAELSGKLDVNVSANPTFTNAMSDLAVHEKNQTQGYSGTVYGPGHNDKIPTNVKEPFGQLNNHNVYYIRAMYPGDVISDRHEILLPNNASKIANSFDAGGGAGRWVLTNIDYLPYIIKDHQFLSQVGIYGRIDTTGEIKRYYLSEGVMKAETVTHHPFTGQTTKPGEVIRCGSLPDGWNIPRDEMGALRRDEFLLSLQGPDIKDIANKDINKAVALKSEKAVPGTMFTTRANADPTKFYKVRELDMVVDYDDPEILRRYTKGEGRTRENYFELGKLEMGGKQEDTTNAIAPTWEPGRPMTHYNGIDDLAKHHTREEISARNMKFWNQKYKYSFYFSPNADAVVDEETGKFRAAKLGDYCVAYDPEKRLVWHKHNHGTISLSSERNRNFSPPYLCRKTHFYIHNPTIVSYMLQFCGNMMNFDAQQIAQDPFFQDAREIAKYIETIDIGGGAEEPDGTPIFKAAFAKSRMYGDLASTSYRAARIVGGSALASVVSAAAIGAATQYATAGLTTAALAGLTIPALAAGGLAAVATFSIMSGYFAQERKFHFTDYERDFKTDMYRSALKDMSGFSAVKDEMVGFGRALCGLIYTKMQNHNTGQQVETVSYAAVATGAAIAVSALAGFTMGAAIPLVSALTVAGGGATLGGLGVGLAKMADVGEKHFKHLYFFESSKMTHTEAFLKGRPNDQYTRIAPSDHTKRNPAIFEHAELFKEGIKLPSETPKPERGKKNALTTVAKDQNGLTGLQANLRKPLPALGA